MSTRATPLGIDRENPREWIEVTLLGYHRAISGAPPVAGEESRGDAVATGPVPDEHPTRLEDACELANHLGIIRGLGEETEGREQVDHGVESAAPARGELSHVGAGVAQLLSCPAFAGALQERRRIVHAVHVVSRLRQQVRMASLTTGAVKDSRSHGKGQYVDESRHLAAVLREVEERFVLQQVPLVEVRGPPVRLRQRQKNTGSRYAPKTLSSAARIS